MPPDFRYPVRTPKCRDRPRVTGLNALLFTIARARHGYMMGNRFDLFLDFKEKFPHSSSQLDTHND